jgi:hypothetical protein
VETKLVDVFDHIAVPEVTEKLRAAVIDDIRWAYDTFPDIRKVSLADVGPDVYQALKQKYGPLLHFGSFNLTKSRPLANELVWKWTEATGKYVGCQFWSRNAKAWFDTEVLHAGGWPIAPALARKIERKLSEKSAQGVERPPGTRLTHEHVYPIKDMKQRLYGNTRRTVEELRGLFDSHCVGCVVLESEHDRFCGDETNPWIRYAKARIKLADNPAWSYKQRQMIVEAGLL